MKHLIANSTVLLALTALTTTAVAQPASETEDPPPPTTTDYDRDGKPIPKEDVSTLDGELVEVGDQNRYRYSYKKYNVSTNPLGIIMGSYGVSMAYAVSENIAVRGDVNYYDPIDTDVRGVELGAGLPIYFRKVHSGLFLEPGVMVRTMSYEDYEGGSDSTTTVGPQVLVGWHWYWDSGLNAAVAFGVGRNWATNDSSEYDVDDEELFPNGYLRFGYAF